MVSASAAITSADSGTQIQITGPTTMGSNSLTLDSTTAVAGFYVDIKGKAPCIYRIQYTSQGKNIDGKAYIFAYVEEFRLYYDTASGTYMTQNRRRGEIDAGFFSTSASTFTKLWGNFDGTLADLECEGFDVDYQVTGGSASTTDTIYFDPNTYMVSTDVAGSTVTGTTQSNVGTATLCKTANQASRGSVRVRNIIPSTIQPYTQFSGEAHQGASATFFNGYAAMANTAGNTLTSFSMGRTSGTATWGWRLKVHRQG